MFLGLDIGASYCKAVVMDQDKRVLCLERAPMPSFIPQSPRYNFIREVDPDKVLDVVIALLMRIKRKVREDIQGIGVAGQMHGILLVNKLNKPKSNFISWQDTRTTKSMPGKTVSYFDFLKNRLSDLRYQTGTDLRPGMLGPVLFWLQQNKYPYLSKSKATFLSDFIGACLTGNEVACDVTQAAGSGVYSLVDQGWSKSYLKTAHISENILPRVVKPGTQAGQISDSISRKTGIKQGTPVYTSVGDYQAALFASNIDMESLSINIGTGAQVTFLSKTRKYFDQFETRPFFDGHSLNCISGLPAGRSIKSFFLSHGCKYDLEKPEGLYYDLLESMVKEYVRAYTLIKGSVPKRIIKRIILSGGVGRKSKTIQKLIRGHFGYKITMSLYSEEAAAGAALIARKYSKMAESSLRSRENIGT